MPHYFIHHAMRRLTTARLFTNGRVYDTHDGGLRVLSLGRASALFPLFIASLSPVGFWVVPAAVCAVDCESTMS